MAFKPPPASAGRCNGVSFEDAENVAADNKAAFDAFDKTPKGQNDPRKCKAPPLFKYLELLRRCSVNSLRVNAGVPARREIAFNFCENTIQRSMQDGMEEEWI